MPEVVTIAGSPATPSRSSAILDRVRCLLEGYQITTEDIQVRALPLEALFYARVDDPSIQNALRAIENASALVIGTPIYKAAYTGVLKSFLDLLPQRAFADKVILPIATGGAPGHQLAIDYALKPVLSALGAQHILAGLYIQDSQIQFTDGLQLEASTEKRLLEMVERLASRLALTRTELSLAAGR